MEFQRWGTCALSRADPKKWRRNPNFGSILQNNIYSWWNYRGMAYGLFCNGWTTRRGKMRWDDGCKVTSNVYVRM